MDNKCHRCGKVRLEVKSWEEEVVTANGTSRLTYTTYQCPDASCQKEADLEFEQKRIATKEREQATKDREKARLESRSNSLKKSRKALASS